MEALRRIVRGVLGYDSPIYRAASDFTNFATVIGTEGPGTWRTLKQLNSKTGTTPSQRAVPVQLRKLNHPIMLRPGTEDASTVMHTIVREEYGSFHPAADPKVMIDAGAYIGDTTAYFLSRFKNLRTISLEPSKTTYEAARANIAPYSERAVLLNKGLAFQAGRLKFQGSTTGASLSDEGEEIDCTSIPELIASYGLERIDILKMDIEGAETEIFKSNPEAWLPRVQNVLIELHGKEAEEVVLGTLRKAGFSIRQFRSVYYCSRTA